MRELTVGECNKVAGGMDMIVVYGSYSGGGSWCTGWQASSYISSYNDYNYWNCTGAAYVDYWAGGDDYYYDQTTQDVVTVINSIPELKAAMIESAAVTFHVGEQAINIAHVSEGVANNTVQIALSDINYWRQIQGHVPYSQGSAVDWTTLAINWDNYGADNPNLSAEEVFINFAQAAMQKP